MFRKILVPLDGSELALKVLDYLEPVLALGASNLVVLRVRPRGTSGPGPEPEQLSARLERLSVEHRLQRIERDGDPAAEILAVVEGEGASLLALCTHGRTGLARLVRGSVAERVLRRVRVPVLLVNPFTQASSARFERILVPLDGSETSLEVLDLVAEFASVYGAEVVLLHVGRPDYRVNAAGERLEEVRAAAFRAEIAPVVARLEATGLRVKVEVRIEFAPAEEILAAVQREGIDLVALATHGRSGASRWIYGSVAEAVIRECRVPLLVKRVAAIPMG